MGKFGSGLQALLSKGKSSKASSRSNIVADEEQELVDSVAGLPSSGQNVPQSSRKSTSGRVSPPRPSAALPITSCAAEQLERMEEELRQQQAAYDNLPSYLKGLSLPPEGGAHRQSKRKVSEASCLPPLSPSLSVLLASHQHTHHLALWTIRSSV